MNGPGAETRRLTRAVLAAAVLGLFCRTFVLTPMAVSSSSMEDTLLPGDHVVFARLMPAVGEPQRGDVLLLRSPEGERWLIKRCVALPGDRVEMRSGRLLVGGEARKEPWARIGVGAGAGDWTGPIDLGADEYFVLGDHRGVSRDSRHWGPVSRHRLAGRAFVIYWSAAPIGESGWDTIESGWRQRLLAIRWDRTWQRVR